MSLMSSDQNTSSTDDRTSRDVSTSTEIPSPKTLKKRTRCRRRKHNKDHHKSSSSSVSSNESSSCNGYVSESSSSDHSKLGTRRSMTPKKSKPVISIEEQAQYVALDCEMVGIGPYGTKSTLARVTIVNWDGDIVYDQLIRPNEIVTDYRTFVSGITEADLNDETRVIDFDTCRLQVLDVLEGKILIGHALKNDLTALQIHHPWQQIRDTAKYEPFMKQRFDDQIYWPRKLKELVYEYLNGMTIQEIGKPHSSYEDANAAMMLYQHVRNKWEKVMAYKIRKTAEIEYHNMTMSTTTTSPVSNHHHHHNIIFPETTWPKLVSPSSA